MKATCWCCATCKESRQRWQRECGDSQDVFLPSLSTVSATDGNGRLATNEKKTKLDSGQSVESGGGGQAELTTMDGRYCDSDSVSDIIGSDCNLFSEDSVLSDLICFDETNPIEHVIQAMYYHPRYLASFLNTHQYLLRGNGPLPYDYRHYIAIMASGRHRCSYLVNALTSEFLLNGGDEKWLSGLDYAPRKLQNLSEINKILAHRPWNLSTKHIEKLTKGSDNWSISELTHALVLLAHFHSLSSFVFACGITLESESDKQRLSSSSRSNSDPSSLDKSSSGSDVEIEFLLERMKRLSEANNIGITSEELLDRFDKIESQTAEFPAKVKSLKNLDLCRFVDDSDFAYQDFVNRDPDPDVQTFMVQDYSWEDHGFSLSGRLYMEIGMLLDDKFQIAQGLTYYKMGDKHNVDTTTFRRAIWNYIHCLFGMYHDDYDYGEINHLLEKHLKSYIKSATCFPETITHRNYCGFMKEFLHSEKVHINIMVLEARLQAELLYSLRAISRYMT